MTRSLTNENGQWLVKQLALTLVGDLTVAGGNCIEKLIDWLIIAWRVHGWFVGQLLGNYGLYTTSVWVGLDILYYYDKDNKIGVCTMKVSLKRNPCMFYGNISKPATFKDG